MWRLGLLFKGLAIRVIRGGRTNAPELALLHQEILRLERRVEILEAKPEVESVNCRAPL